jgi:short-subunit dehydrogenase
LNAITQQVIPAMRAAGEGLILNVSSIVGRLALPYASSYVATKYAVEGLSESMRYELDPFNIRVKLIEPGSILTEFGKGSMQVATGESYEVSMKKFFGVFAKKVMPGQRVRKRLRKLFTVPRMMRQTGCAIWPSPARSSG